MRAPLRQESTRLDDGKVPVRLLVWVRQLWGDTEQDPGGESLGHCYGVPRTAGSSSGTGWPLSAQLALGTSDAGSS